MHFHRRLGDTNIRSDLLVKAARRGLDHDLALAGAERFIPLPERGQRLFGISSRAVASKTCFDRIDEIWIDCRHRFGAGGPWLFGAEYTIADAMYAPVVLRFHTYGAQQLSEAGRWYLATALEDPALQEWMKAARAEPWTVAADEVG